MASLLRKLSYNSYTQCRSLHKIAVGHTVPLTFNQYEHQQRFREAQAEIVGSLMSSPKFKDQLGDVEVWMTKLLDYALGGGKRGRGLAVPFAYRMMEDPEHFTEDNHHKARIMGWVLEMFHSYLFTIDDIMDASKTRRGQQCWYLRDDVGMGALNDSGLIFSSAYEVLEQHFGDDPIYAELVRICNGAMMHTCIGQHLDFASNYRREKNNLDTFTVERFDAIALQKTAIYSFKFPMNLAMTLVKGKNQNLHHTEDVHSICWDMGKLLQLINDYKDIYFDEIKTGKAGTDIQEGKLTWLAVTALERCTDAQRKFFAENYGIDNPENVQRIKDLFAELDIENIYKNHEKAVYEDLVRRIRALPTKGQTRFYSEVLEACCKQLY
ncbi:farnesyl pyrophosphate synthase 2-like [Spodoptera litura]|uniref:Farnesyl pyrophosphate synthase 2-like n=1 Tax=Spodoptera litura TaxID=69820 RepID=A0A9J7DVU4_SPOLT|nr:farnesyl pyrophosphate synthase 2-like [Spodoptera litura]XP_022817234.1 farnesyl pyrophosphate synthase 2-like [Spodoptera litura]